jgi:exosome complex component RRP41
MARIDLLLGLLQSCINVTTLALIHAGIPMTDYVVCTSLGLVDKTPILGNFNVADE